MTWRICFASDTLRSFCRVCICRCRSTFVSVYLSTVEPIFLGQPRFGHLHQNHFTITIFTRIGPAFSKSELMFQ